MKTETKLIWIIITLFILLVVSLFQTQKLVNECNDFYRPCWEGEYNRTYETYIKNKSYIHKPYFRIEVLNDSVGK